eukprot:ANDGO_01004.mRNA.1 hypothetical protein
MASQQRNHAKFASPTDAPSPVSMRLKARKYFKLNSEPQGSIKPSVLQFASPTSKQSRVLKPRDTNTPVAANNTTTSINSAALKMQSPLPVAVVRAAVAAEKENS